MSVMEDEKLIALVEQRPALFNKNHPKNSNRRFVKLLWEEVAAELRDDVENTKRRWGYLRDYFQKQYKRVVRSKCGLVAPRKRKWRLFDSLMFLAEDISAEELLSSESKIVTDDDHDVISMELAHQADRESTSTAQIPMTLRNDVSTVQQINEQDIFLHRPDVANFSHFSSKPAKTARFDHAEVALVPKLSSEACVKDDENELFLKSLLPMMRTLDPLEGMQLRQEMQGLLIDYVIRARAASTQKKNRAPGAKPTSTTSTANMTDGLDGAGDGSSCQPKVERNTRPDARIRQGVSFAEDMADNSPQTSANTSPTPSSTGDTDEGRQGDSNIQGLLLS